MKINLKILMVIVIIIMIVLLIYINKQEEFSLDLSSVDFNIFYENMKLHDEMPTQFNVTEKEIEGVTLSNPLSKRYYINDEVCYTLKPIEDGASKENVKFSKYASDQLMAVMYLGYPGTNYKDLGLRNEDEAYMATQIAMWEIAIRTGEVESDNWENKYVITNRTRLNDKNINSAVFDVAEEIIARVEKEGFTKYPILISDTESVKLNESLTNSESNTIGPYRVRIENAIYPKFEVTVTSKDGREIEYEIVDEDGNIISEIENNQNFYVKTIKEEKNINIHIDGSTYKTYGRIIKNENCEFLCLNTVLTALEQDLGVNYTK